MIGYKNHKSDFIKMTDFHSLKNTIKNTNRGRDWEKIFAKVISNNGFLSSMQLFSYKSITKR